MLSSIQFKNRTLHGTVARQISAALSEPDDLVTGDDRRQAETLDDNLAAKIKDLDDDVLPDASPISAASGESDDLLEGDGLRDAKILDDILDGKLDDLDDDGEEAELTLVIGDDVLPDDDDDESISEIDGVEYTIGMFDEH